MIMNTRDISAIEKIIRENLQYDNTFKLILDKGLENYIEVITYKITEEVLQYIYKEYPQWFT